MPKYVINLHITGLTNLLKGKSISLLFQYICCLVHCEWNDWVIGECSETCGGGSRTNTRTQKTAAEFGGDECDGPTSSTESCNVEECPGGVYPLNGPKINFFSSCS